MSRMMMVDGIYSLSTAPRHIGTNNRVSLFIVDSVTLPPLSSAMLYRVSKALKRRDTDGQEGASEDTTLP